MAHDMINIAIDSEGMGASRLYPVDHVLATTEHAKTYFDALLVVTARDSSAYVDF